MLKDRIGSGLLMGLAVIAMAFWMPPIGVLLVLLLLCGLALWEFYGLLDASGIPHFKFVGLLGGWALITVTWLSLLKPDGAPHDSDWLVLFATVTLIFLRQFPQKNNPRPLMTIAGTLLGVMYVPFLFNFFTKLLMTWGEAGGRWMLVYMIVVVKLTDVGAYFAGCNLGRHKLIPRISPAKTWEGCVGGILAGTLASILFYVIADGRMGGVPMTLGDSLCMGVLLAVTGIVGDLTESLFKRAAGMKDSGRIIRGMGGLLDVLDSLLFAAPAMYAYVRFFME